MADVAGPFRPEQLSSVSSEPQIRTIWNSLLEPNILKYGSRYLRDEDECAINMVLQVIHTKFKSSLKQSRRLLEENKFYQEELKKREKQVTLLEKKLCESDEQPKCSSCQKYVEDIRVEREKYKSLEEKMKICASFMNTMVNKEPNETKTLNVSEIMLAINASCSTSASATESPPSKSSLKLSRKQLEWHTGTTNQTSDMEVIVPDTPERAGTSEESSLEKTTICVPETVPFDFADRPEIAGGRHLRLRKPSLPSPIMDCIPSKTVFTPTKPVVPQNSLLTSTKVESATPSNVQQEELSNSNCYSPPIFTTSARKQDEMPSDSAAAGANEEDSDDDFRSCSRKKGMFERLQLKASVKSKSKSRHLSLSKSQSETKLPDPPVENARSDRIESSLIPPSAPSTASKDVPIDEQQGTSSAAAAYIGEPVEREAKRRRRIKGPEDWPCGECRRLLYESKIDVKKLKPSMNFCPEHRNRMSYYLNTPPGFWNPVIIGSPRKRRPISDQEEIQ